MGTKTIIFVGGIFDGQRVNALEDSNVPDTTELKFQIDDGPIFKDTYQRVSKDGDVYVYSVMARQSEG